MKRLITYLLLISAALTVMASPVDSTRAVQVARNFVAQYVKGANQMEASVVYAHKMPKGDKAAIYAVNMGSAFVLVSADDVAHPVLGYSLSRPWPTRAALPSQVSAYLDDLAGQIEAASSHETDRETTAEWQQLLTEHLILTTNLPDSVGPLLTTTWDQDQYYNALCPEDANGPAGHVYTGCVATAMAQIINYWGYPVHGRGTHSYPTNYGTLSVNYDSASYDYAHMPNVLTATSTPQEINAVATLMRDCGVAANMGYGPNESSSYDVDARAGMINFFRFSPDLSYAEKASFTNAEWENMLRTDIAANRPVMYSGHGDNGGHSFVCDGYKQNGYFHFNFGWSGYSDGWYVTNAVNGFNSSQSAILGIIPDSTGNIILGQMDGTSIFIVDETLEYYHLLGHNAFHGIDYSNSFNSYTTFIASDTSYQLKADLVNFGGDQSVRVYYGLGNDYYMVYPDMIWFPPLESYNGSFIMDYSGYWHYAGFCLRISKKDSCDNIPFFDVSYTVDTNQINLSWIGNDNTEEWNIEYGSEGHAPGSGTTLTTDTTYTTINNLNPYVYYDVYLKPVCSDFWTGPITIKTDLSYWQDYVSEQPSGITYNADGYALVSTPEQLAWLVSEKSTCEKILLTADLDMNGHRWKPVNVPYHSGGNEIDGKGHSITNLLIRESKTSLVNYIGFYSDLSPYEWPVFIHDLTFVNPYICAERSVGSCGVLAGSIRTGNATHTIKNCGIKGGFINCKSFSAGGLIGGFKGDMLNCYANVNITNMHANPHTGGLIGDMYDGTMINCYSASDIVYTPFICSKGQVVGGVENGEIRNVYGKRSSYSLLYNQYGQIIDTASFGDNLNFYTDIVFEDSAYSELCSVLNEGVLSRNDSTWRLWRYDSIQRYPILDGLHKVTCNNVSGLSASNVIHEGQNALKLSWDSNLAASYIVKCVNISNSTDSVRLYTVVSNPCFIEGLQQESKYEIYVRCNCDSSHSGWGESVTIINDKPYWTDIVTAQPAGYVEDADGNVTIASAEGLAWLSCRVNGLNGNNPFNFRNKKVSLISDIDLGQYKWLPIGNSQTEYFNVPWSIEFQGIFNGNGHTISNMYINEDADRVGLFGTLFQAKVINITIKNSHVKGLIHVGGLCGIYGNSSTSWDEFNYGNTIFDNCHVIQSEVSGKNRVGGLCGLLQQNINDVAIRNCSSSGNVSGISEFGGLIGFIAQYSNKKIENCFSFSNVFCTESNDYGNGYYGGLIGYAVNTSITNCYTAGIIDTLIIGGYTGSMIGVLDNSQLNYMYGILNTIYNPYTPWGVYSVQNTTMFSMNENHYVFQTPITIENTTYTDLLSALNAWVDANDAEGVYRHWAADSTGENGGFPVFAYVPCTPATGSDSITVCDNYTWNGIVYTTNTVFVDTLSTMEGCDSIVTHYLTVNHGSTGIDTVSATDSYTWADSTYTTSGIYQRTWSNANGCDSTVSLWLTITKTQVDTLIQIDTLVQVDTLVITDTLTLTDTITLTDTLVVTQYDTVIQPIHDTAYVDVHDTTYIDVHDTTYVPVHDTAYINVFVHDTTIIHDTSYVNVPYPVYDTTIIHDTSYVNVPYPVHDTTIIHDTSYVNVPYPVYDTTIIHDTSYVNVPYPVHDTTIIHDTSYINVPYPVHDTTIIHDTSYVNVPYPVHDTTIIHDTSYVNVPYPVHDTTIIHDTSYVNVPYPVHDTTIIHDTSYVNVPYPVHDTTYIDVHDTTIVVQTDTLTLYDTITITIYDTITLYDTIYDTIYIDPTGIGDVQTINAKIYQRDGKIVVEGAEGYPVTLYDAVGRRMDAKKEDGTVELTVPASGVYLVKIGNLPARRVVVLR